MMARRPDPIGRWILLAAFFLTGISSLVFEVVWTRILLLSLGATPVAVSTVLGAFMAGMAAGAAAGGRSWLRRHDPVVVYAALEAFAGVYAWASPWLLTWVEVAAPGGRALTAAALLMPATVAMGASLPVLARAVGPGSDSPAAGVGRLYAANTAGACLGPVVAVFVLFPAVGLATSLWLAGGVNLVVAAGLLLVRPMRSTATADGVEDAVESPGPAGRPDPLVVAMLTVSGGAAMVYEVAWSRTLTSVFGSSAYGVSIMLSVFLVGLAAGAAGAAAWLRRRTRPVAAVTLAWILIGASGAAFVSLVVARRLPFAFLALHQSLGAGTWAPFLSQFLLSALLMAPSTLLMGAALPVAVGTIDRPRDLGNAVSRLYTGNLLGSAAGAVLASWVLLAGLGMETSVRAASILVLATAGVVAARRAAPAIRPVAVSACAAIFVLVLDPSAPAVQKSFGFYAVPDSYRDYDSAAIRQLLSAHRVLYYRDGATATVAVQEVDRYRLLKINGKTDASNGIGDLEMQLLLGHLPLMATDAKRVAVVGWGSGDTVGAVLTHPVETVDAFEIEPAVVEASRYFEPENGQPLEDPRLRLVLGDARTQLRERGDEYDLIISEPSNPWLTGVASLFTQDFFEEAAARLSADGVFCQWFHLYGMSEESTRSLVATFRSVFPHMLAFKDRDLILLGSRAPIRFSFPRMQALFERPAVRDSLARAFIAYPADILVQLSLDEGGAASFGAGGALNTDDNMRLELAAPRSLYQDQIELIRTSMAEQSAVPADVVGGYPSEAALHLELAASLFTAGRNAAALDACRRSLDLDESFDGLKLLGQILEREGDAGGARQAWARALTVGGDTAGRAFVTALLQALEATPQ
jgi:spermidine synthase